jgi:hypothetical protein
MRRSDRRETQSSVASKQFSSDDPWGRRGLASGWAGDLGQADPAIPLPAKRRRWREGCLRPGALTARTGARCGSAVSVTGKQRPGRQRNIVRPFIPWRRELQSGKYLHEQNKGVTEARGSERTMFVVCGVGSQGEATGAQLASTVSRAGRSCQPRRAARRLLPGLLGDSVTCLWRVAPARALIGSDSSPASGVR